MTERQCGDCYTCCVVLGIEALKKYAMQTCKNLSGVNPEKRCTIYERRPTACSNYQCTWRIGMLKDTMRPNECGFIVTPYEDRWVIQVFDVQKAGNGVTEGLLLEAIKEILERSKGKDEVAVLYRNSGIVVVWKNGYICEGHVLRQGKGKYEDLSYALKNKPVSKYTVAELPRHES